VQTRAAARALAAAAEAAKAHPEVELPSSLTTALSAALGRLLGALGGRLPISRAPRSRPASVTKARAPIEPRRPSVRGLDSLKPVTEHDLDALGLAGVPWELEAHPGELDLTDEVSGCRALLLGIVYRAASDWVLYRASSRLEHRVIAEDAYHWLFLEGPEVPGWSDREARGELLTAFVTICETLELDPERVRRGIRKLTFRDVLRGGRPAERARSSGEDVDAGTHSLREVSVDELPTFDLLFAPPP
jgi:hypothetical protein